MYAPSILFDVLYNVLYLTFFKFFTLNILKFGSTNEDNNAFVGVRIRNESIEFHYPESYDISGVEDVTTIKDIKALEPVRKSLGSGQVLHCPYDYNKTKCELGNYVWSNQVASQDIAFKLTTEEEIEIDDEEWERNRNIGAKAEEKLGINSLASKENYDKAIKWIVDNGYAKNNEEAQQLFKKSLSQKGLEKLAKILAVDEDSDSFVDNIDYDNIEYPKGTSKEYTMSVNKKFNDALPILQKLGIKLEDFGGRRSKEGGYEDNSSEIMDKYVFNPFSEKYPTGRHNEEWTKDYKPIYDAIDAVTDKNYNDWWIREHSKKEAPKQTEQQVSKPSNNNKTQTNNDKPKEEDERKKASKLFNVKL